MIINYDYDHRLGSDYSKKTIGDRHFLRLPVVTRGRIAKILTRISPPQEFY